MSESTTYQSTICLDTDEGCVEDCPAKFAIEVTTSKAEPYSWGQSRGAETDARAKLISITFGNLTLDKSQCEAITGEKHIAEQEERVAEQYLEDLSMGDAA